MVLYIEMPMPLSNSCMNNSNTLEISDTLASHPCLLLNYLSWA